MHVDICELRSDMEEEVDKLKEQISELHVTVGSNCDIPQIIGTVVYEQTP